MENIVKPVIQEAFIVGAASLLVGSVGFTTAVAVGGTYALISKMTEAFFKDLKAEKGKEALRIFANAALVAGLVNLTGLSIKVSKVAYISLLPVMAMAKIALFGAIGLGIALYYGCSKASSCLQQLPIKAQKDL